MPTKAPAKKSTAKKAAAKKPATRTALKRDPRTERMVLKAVTALRDNPDKYRELRASLDKASSDEERAKQLLRYATSERQLSSLLPGKAGQAAIITWTTVTVTTVTFLDAPQVEEK